MRIVVLFALTLCSLQFADDQTEWLKTPLANLDKKTRIQFTKKFTILRGIYGKVFVNGEPTDTLPYGYGPYCGINVFGGKLSDSVTISDSAPPLEFEVVNHNGLPRLKLKGSKIIEYVFCKDDRGYPTGGPWGSSTVADFNKHMGKYAQLIPGELTISDP